MKTMPDNYIKPMVLVVLDGWGVAGGGGEVNAITAANKPNLDSYYSSFPHTVLEAAGESVGLPHGEVGNSEVGHMNLGAGRVVYQDLPRINTAIADGAFLRNLVFKEAINNAKKNNSNVHLLGLVGSGGVHSSVEHLYALLWLLKQSGIATVYLHLFTDGRDSPPSSALQFFKELDSKLKEIKIGQVVSISGRYYAMDRDNRWDKTEKAYKTIVTGSRKVFKNPFEAIDQSYKGNITDEFIEPSVISDGKRAPVFVKENDSVIFFNFRPDRARQLTKAFMLDEFIGFSREKIKNLYFVSMTEYERNLGAHVAFPAPIINNPLSLVVSTNNIQQFHIGETEKYAHVTYFFNGGIETPFAYEDRLHIPSPKVATYDLKPEMSAHTITDIVVKKLRSAHYGFYIINFANADMVAHTGSLKATIEAVQILDFCVGKIVDEAYPMGGTVVVVGDHGNAEQMINPITKGVDTEHTSNPVPFLAISDKLKDKKIQLQSGTLADVAPTMLYLMGNNKPTEMTGRNLLIY